MERDQIRRAIAEDLRGKPSRNPLSLIPELAKKLGVEVDEINYQLLQMVDLGYVFFKNHDTSIRLLNLGDRFYFASRTERCMRYIKNNGIALLALLISVLSAFFTIATQLNLLK